MADTEDATNEQDIDAMFDLKKKKKKSKKKSTESTENENKADEATAPADDSTKGSAEKTENNENKSGNIFEVDPPTYSYSLLLNRVVDFVHKNNPELADKKRFTMKPPQLMRGKQYILFFSNIMIIVLSLFTNNKIKLVPRKRFG
jgi:hypothetical protein